MNSSLATICLATPLLFATAKPSLRLGVKQNLSFGSVCRLSFVIWLPSKGHISCRYCSTVLIGHFDQYSLAAGTAQYYINQIVASRLPFWRGTKSSGQTEGLTSSAMFLSAALPQAAISSRCSNRGSNWLWMIFQVNLAVNQR